MYTTLFVLTTIGTLLFYVASGNVRSNDKPQWAHRLGHKPRLAKTIGTLMLLISWAAAVYLQGAGSGTFAMVGYLMTSYSLMVLFIPLRYFSTARLAIVASLAFFLEMFIF